MGSAIVSTPDYVPLEDLPTTVYLVTVPERIIREKGYRVTRVNNSDTYIESNYVNLFGGQDCSVRPDSGVPLGEALISNSTLLSNQSGS